MEGAHEALATWWERQASREREEAEALDAAAGGGDDFDSEVEGRELNDFAGFGDAAFDFADEAAEGCGLPGFVEIDRLADEVAELIGREAARNEP